MAQKAPNLEASRILNASRVAQATDDTDVADWNKADEFIVVAQIDEASGPWDAAYTLRWRDVTDSGSFAALAATGEIAWGTDTDLTNGDAVVIGEKACTNTPGGSDWQDGEEVEGAATCDSINLADEYYTEIHFACDPAGADGGHEYEFQLWDETNGAEIGVLLAGIVIASGAIVKIMATETEGLSEAEVRRGWAVRMAAESVGLVDAALRRLWSVRLSAETEGISEGAVRRMRSVRLFAETVGLSDAMLKIAGIVKVASETVGIGETFVRVAGFVKVMAAETVGLTESFVKRFWSVRQTAETVSLSETFVKRAWMVRLMTSAVGLQESVVRRMWAVRLKAETLGIGDSSVRIGKTVRLLSETVGIAETFVKSLSAGAIVKLMTETVGITEGAVKLTHRVWVRVREFGRQLSLARSHPWVRWMRHIEGK